MTPYNTWDYKEGDLILVEKRGWPSEIGVVTAFRDTGPSLPRKYWEWHGTSGKTMFFFEIKSAFLEKDHKVKVLARAKANDE
tara:strand:- start:62 stop:307 length:246 start_codon:yes stop_codon:yes gene_type:complete